MSGNYEPFPTFEEWVSVDFDAAAFDRYEELFYASKESATEGALRAALTAATRYAAFDTGAIEGLYSTDRGFTRTVAMQAAAWEQAIESRGEAIRSAFDDAMNAYEYVLDAATAATVVSEMWIKELHEIVCSSQDAYTVYTEHGPEERPLPKGRYKSMPNSPTRADGSVHAYASVLDTPPEMERLIRELRSPAFEAAHPVVQAAYAHYAYVCVHPFADGNGRVARALASVYLYRRPGIPLVVFADQRNEYFDALEAADRGDPQRFLTFIGVRVVDTIGIMRSILDSTAPPVETTVTNLNQLFGGDATDAEIRAAAVRLRTLAQEEARRQIESLTFPDALKVRAGPGVRTVADRPGYGGLGREADMMLTARATWPVEIRVYMHLSVLGRLEDATISELLIKSDSDDGVEVWLRELSPVVSETLKLKLSAWIEARLAYFLAEVEAAGRRQLP